jgi:hypothetical protein
MVNLKNTGAWKIFIYAGDHPPPHFHVLTGDGQSSVDIATLREQRSGANKRALKGALEWALENRATLMTVWNEQNNPRRKP